MPQPNVFCIFHANCMDGFTAAWIVYRKMKSVGIPTEFHGASYGSEPPYDMAEGQDVMIVDFSYPRNQLSKLAEVAHSLVVLDHHKTAQAELANLTLSHTRIVFDMERSGAQITWDDLHPMPVGVKHGQKPRPALVDYVGDRDLWKFELPRSKEVSAYIALQPKSFAAWDALHMELESNFNYVAEIGYALVKQHENFVEDGIDITERQMVIGGFKVPVVNLPPYLASEAGNVLARRGVPFAAVYYDGPKGRAFSLRSTDDGEDVSVIAKKYLGGGHRNAAGFLAPIGWEGEGD